MAPDDARGLGRKPRHKGRRNLRYPRLTLEQILAWVDAHLGRTGRSRRSGRIFDAPREKWTNIDDALMRGFRGLPGGSSLARLLAQRRGNRHSLEQPPLSDDQILIWADSHHRTTGRWPTKTSGAVADAPGEQWRRIDAALRDGRRGLAGGSSLARLLAARRGRRYAPALPVFTISEILSWADAHFESTRASAISRSLSTLTNPPRPGIIRTAVYLHPWGTCR